MIGTASAGFAFAAALAASALITQRALAQKAPGANPPGAKPQDQAPTDPYNAIEGMEYRSTGPGWWTPIHSTRDIELVLGGWPLLWVETKHFRVGCSLKPRHLPSDPDDRRLLREDLVQLHRRVPAIPERATALDPWLQAHLLAHRLEQLHQQIETILGAPPEGIEATPANPLAIEDRIGVLVVETAVELQRYRRSVGAEPTDEPLHHRLDKTRVIALTAASPSGYLDTVPLRQHVTYHATHALLREAWGHRDDLPHWWTRGLATWLQRQATEKHSEMPPSQRMFPETPSQRDWSARIRARAQHDIAPKAVEIFAWTDEQQLDLVDAAACWSRLAFLMDTAPDGARAFFAHCKEAAPGCFDGDSPARVGFASRTALKAGYDLTPAAFDASWKRWVLKK